jgi:site-specific recombinase XerD
MGEMTIREAVHEYKTVFMPSRNFAFRTREEYKNDIEDLELFLERSGIYRVGEIGLVNLDRYLADLDNRNLAGSTRKRKVISIRTFLAFLHRFGFITTDISKQVIPPYAENPLPRILTHSEYRNLLDSSRSNVRDFAIITLLLQTGIRLSELVRLTINDIDLIDHENSSINMTGTVRIIAGGGRKDRHLPLNSKACQALQAYYQMRPEVETNVVFISNKGYGVGDRGVQKIITKYMDQAGIKGASVQSLRHTFAVQHLIKGTSLETIREILGHNDIRTTEIYIPLAKEMAKKELEENAL